MKLIQEQQKFGSRSIALFSLFQNSPPPPFPNPGYAPGSKSLNITLSTIVTKHVIFSRGGVEDTRLEAKAKDTKKIRGQGQPFRGQNLSRPRTGMLEAKDQGHRRKCSPKKKEGLQKFFLGDLQFIGVPRIFDWGKPST